MGVGVGPDLTKIGAKYDKAGLLEQILEPSKTIDPAFAAYLLETKDGRVVSGLAVEKTANDVVLKDSCKERRCDCRTARSSGWFRNRDR